ncbi:cupin domain-containing protein [Thalassotalea marina]|uniref:DUF985 domain-containing protein n=1 Tax=Thalassotalea marina TaxID=1673741 RepID=A0A919BBU5_9GAMM|nr:cupin domain-containing protein [Thalassotalea marina]GHF77919.1 hypothetical protein GCM10017161_01170 [Thalassotalea marina]
MTTPQDNCVYSIAYADQVDTILAQSHYQAPSIVTEGFMHLCRYHQVQVVVDSFYAEQTDLKLLIIDTSLLDAELRYEAPAGKLVTNAFDHDVFPHLYGALNTNAIIDVIDLERFNAKPIHPDTAAIIRHYQFQRLPVEGTLFTSTYRSEQVTADNGPLGTAMIGLYANSPESVSCFHKLTHDEIWHVYGGDPFTLYLLYPDGTSEEIVMGMDPTQGHLVQYVIPAGVWQAGCLNEGGRFALFGCTMAPGFTGDCFEAATVNELCQAYPNKAEIIKQLSVNGHEKSMPAGFAS